MISDKIAQALNDQVNLEMHSGYVYMAMSAKCSEENWEGFAKWFMIQYHEEMFHAMKIYNYILDQGASVALKDVKAAELTANPTVLQLFEKALEHEQRVTKSIHNLMGLARAENDYATEGLLSWYVEEQVEEEKNATENIAHLKRIGESTNGLYWLDKRLAKRSLGVNVNFSEWGEGEEEE